MNEELISATIPGGGGPRPTIDQGAIPEKRTLEDIAGEIRTFTASMLNNVIEIGRRMCEAKMLVPYGQWGTWIRENTGYSVSTADNFMRLFQEYGAAQGSLFGAEVDSQTFGKLSYTKALALLAVPREERESFAEKVGAEHLSTRELQEAIRERDEALKREKAAREELLQADEGHALALSELREELDAARREAAQGKDAREQQKKAEEEKNALERKLSEAQDSIRELESRPVQVAVERDEAAIQDAAREARIKAEAVAAEQLRALQKKLDAAEKKAEKAEKAAEKAKADAEKAGQSDKTELAKAAQEAAQARREAETARSVAEELRRQLKLADPSATVFKAYFDQLQKLWAGMMDVIGDAEPEMAAKLKTAARALLARLGDYL
ncbi:MAG: DUF3102 domain-containing protein [Oscillospiraceae bacterium]|nr:DUF3102 domain-containing protein [Oscillospiraceae bacterium]